MIKFGSVIRFKYNKADVTAMVIGAHFTGRAETDEGTAWSDDAGERAIVLGLDYVGGEGKVKNDVRGRVVFFHDVGITATFDLEDNYDVVLL